MVEICDATDTISWFFALLDNMTLLTRAVILGSHELGLRDSDSRQAMLVDGGFGAEKCNEWTGYCNIISFEIILEFRLGITHSSIEISNFAILLIEKLLFRIRDLILSKNNKSSSYLTFCSNSKCEIIKKSQLKSKVCF